jgi:gluconate 2-dehydrogenase gamma chain
MTYDVTRRSFVEAVAGAAAAAWLTAAPRDLQAAGAHAAVSGPQDKWLVLTADQAREFDFISAQIVPSDGTPGAREANVVRFLDRSLATWAKDQKEPVAAAFKALATVLEQMHPGAKSLGSLSDAEQIAVLKAWEKAPDGLFGLARAVTMVGMFSNPSYGGNANKAGWKILGFVDQYSWVAPFGYYDHV